MEIIKVVLKQLFLKPATNKFPAKYAPESTIQFLNLVLRRKLKMIPPIAVPLRFRGKILYDKYRCWGCMRCIRVCPTRAIERVPEEQKVKIFVSRCCFCAQCTEICPAGVLHMSDEFLLSSYNKYAEELVVTR